MELLGGMLIAWIAGAVVAAVVIGVIALAMRPANRALAEPDDDPWNERIRPTNDPFFKNMEYYSRH